MRPDRRKRVLKPVDNIRIVPRARDHNPRRLKHEEHDRRALRAHDEPRENRRLVRAERALLGIQPLDVDAHVAREPHVAHNVLDRVEVVAHKAENVQALQHFDDAAHGADGHLPTNRTRDDELARGEEQRRRARVVDADRDGREFAAVVDGVREAAPNEREVDAREVRVQVHGRDHVVDHGKDVGAVEEAVACRRVGEGVQEHAAAGFRRKGLVGFERGEFLVALLGRPVLAAADGRHALGVGVSAEVVSRV